MRVFLFALLATIVVSVGSIFALNTAQRTTGAAYTTDGARTDPAWNWRRIVKKPLDVSKAGAAANTGARVDPASMRRDDDESTSAAEACEQAGALKWLFVDFGDQGDETSCHA